MNEEAVFNLVRTGKQNPHVIVQEDPRNSTCSGPDNLSQYK